MRFPWLPLGFLPLSLLLAAEPSQPAADAAKDGGSSSLKEPVAREATVTIAGTSIPYRATSGKLVLQTEDGKPSASIFHITYERTDITDRAARPVLFAFNGGPGSSSVWLHLGILGPRKVDLAGDGTTAPPPPARVVENPYSLLDYCDLVFIDPVSTGYSRAEPGQKASDFHGLEGDIRSVGDFIRRWVTEHDRWASPKFLLGESYGGIRGAGLAQHLQTRFGMALNGVVLMSSLLDFGTLQPAQGSDLSSLVFLPSYASTAHYHRKVGGDRDALVKEARDFAYGAYATALLQGNQLAPETKDQIAATLERLTGLPAGTWKKHDLRIDPTLFRGELLLDEGKVLGRFDSRVAWPSADPASSRAGYDPSYSLTLGAFSTAMLDYLGRDLGWKEESPYEILTGSVRPWRWDAENTIVNVSGRLASALRDNPHLRVLVMAGHTDLATPPEGIAHSIRHAPYLPDTALDRISTTYYEGGHMFYLNPPDLEKARTDLLQFFHSAE